MEDVPIFTVPYLIHIVLALSTNSGLVVVFWRNLNVLGVVDEVLVNGKKLISPSTINYLSNGGLTSRVTDKLPGIITTCSVPSGTFPPGQIFGSDHRTAVLGTSFLPPLPGTAEQLNLQMTGFKLMYSHGVSLFLPLIQR